LARRVAREAVQAGVPISFIAMFGCPVSCGRAAGALLWLRVAA
jgi:dissimilatory sulfite reductase (desulfoviridin) alpha/beta subunit